MSSPDSSTSQASFPEDLYIAHTKSDSMKVAFFGVNVFYFQIESSNTVLNQAGFPDHYSCTPAIINTCNMIAHLGSEFTVLTGPGDFFG